MVLADVGAPGGPALGASAPAAAACAPPETGEHRLVVGGSERGYVVAVPGQEVAAGPWPLVVALHGTGGSASRFGDVSGLGPEGATAGALMVLPDGTGDPRGWIHADRDRDLEFVDAVLDEIAMSGCVDAERIWVTGVSAGSAMAAALVCDRSDVVGAVLVAALPAPCDGPVSADVYVVHGTADDIVPYGGGDFNGDDLGTLPEVAAAWAVAAGCDGPPAGRGVEPDVFVLEWSPCHHGDGGLVSLYSVIGGGHGWLTDGEAAIDATCLVLAAATAGDGAPDVGGCEA
jgi:polyhydroxybutyrate depolymerase